MTVELLTTLCNTVAIVALIVAYQQLRKVVKEHDKRLQLGRWV